MSGSASAPLFQLGSKLLINLLRADGKGNVFLSPVSITTALAMAETGSTPDSNVQRELLSVLNVPDEKTLIEGVVGPALKETGEKQEGVEVVTANSIWANGIKAEFVSAIQQGFAAHAVDHISADEINSWVEGVTKGKITNLVQDVPQEGAVLVNAIYFRGLWQETIDKDRTNEDAEFRLEDGSTTKAALMWLKEQNFLYYKGSDGAQAVSLPYKGHRHQAVLILPPEGATLADFAASVGVDGIKEIVDKMSGVKVEVFLPRIKVAFQADLIDAFKAQGLRETTESTNQWSRLSNESGAIAGVIHKAIIELDEEGTTAAAATAVMFTLTSFMPVMEKNVFRADRPFFIVIYDTLEKVPLFIGGIRNPAE